MYKFFIGVDVSKLTIDVSYFDGKKPCYLGKFDNTRSGFQLMKKRLKEKTGEKTTTWLVLFENTGSYSKLLLQWLIEIGITCVEENPMLVSNSLGFRRGKSDKADSKDLCQYCYTKREVLKPSTLPSVRLVNLKKLLSQRELLVKQRTAKMVSLKDIDPLMSSEIAEMLTQMNQEVIKLFDAQIRQIESMIVEETKKEEEMKENMEFLRSVTGIGLIIAATMIVTTENFCSFKNARKYACYSGVAPFEYQSGTSIRGKTRVSSMANKQVKSLISNGANSAITHDPELRLYFERKRAEGKSYGTVLNAVKNKLIQRAFAVIKRRSPYVNLVKYA
jgi:transposase